MNLFFRPMLSTDLNEIKKMDKLAFTNPWPENAFKYELENNPNARLWIVENSEQKDIIGYAVIWIVLDEAHLGTFAINPAFEGKGIGKKFLAMICSQLIFENIQHIFLEVRKSNFKAIRLYENLGFEIDGERKNYYHDNGETAILMSAKIKAIGFYEDIINDDASNITLNTIETKI